MLLLYVHSICCLLEMNRDSSVNIVTWLRAGRHENYSFFNGRGNQMSVTQNFQIENGPRRHFFQRVPLGFFPLDQSGHGVKFTAYHHPRPRLRMCGAKSPLPNTPHRIIKDLNVYIWINIICIRLKFLERLILWRVNLS